jgi:hypothetical protein
MTWNILPINQIMDENKKKYYKKNFKKNFVTTIPYDILENIISHLKIDDIINFLLSSKKIYKIYIKNDENYGCNKITNKIINECALFFKINDKINYNLENKRLLTTSVIKLYNLYKNNKNYNNSDVLVSIMENSIKSNELFRCLCLKSKFCEEMKKINNSDKSVITYSNISGNFIFRSFEKNIISNSDMKYMIINVDKCKLEIILKSFSIKSETVAYCIKEMLKYKHKDYDVKIKMCIDYIFYKYCFKEISQYNKNYFIHIFTYFILNDDKNLLTYFVNKMEKYLKVGILNIDYITQIMYSELKCNYNHYDYLKNCVKNYVNCLINF